MKFRYRQLNCSKYSTLLTLIFSYLCNEKNVPKLRVEIKFSYILRIVRRRQRKVMTRCRFDNSSSEPKDRSNFPNKWALRSFRYDDKGTVDKKRAPRQKDTVRWRTPFTVANSLPDVEIDRRFGSVARGCRAFDRFTQDRLLTHVLNVPAYRWTCMHVWRAMEPGQTWHLWRHKQLQPPKVCQQATENEIFWESLPKCNLFNTSILELIVIDFKIFS